MRLGRVGVCVNGEISIIRCRRWRWRWFGYWGVDAGACAGAGARGLGILGRRVVVAVLSLSVVVELVVDRVRSVLNTSMRSMRANEGRMLYACERD